MADTYCKWAYTHPLHQKYHDEEYGFPLREDDALLERLALEINQAGLSWLTVLRKKDAFHLAFDGFDLEKVASYGEQDIARLMANADIIRNRRKIMAVIENARRIITINEEYGSFAVWLDKHHPLSLPEWVKLFKQSFVFTGGEIVNEFLVSLGYLPGAHEPACPVYAQVVALMPPWVS